MANQAFRATGSNAARARTSAAQAPRTTLWTQLSKTQSGPRPNRSLSASRTVSTPNTNHTKVSGSGTVSSWPSSSTLRPGSARRKGANRPQLLLAESVTPHHGGTIFADRRHKKAQAGPRHPPLRSAPHGAAQGSDRRRHRCSQRHRPGRGRGVHCRRDAGRHGRHRRREPALARDEAHGPGGRGPGGRCRRA